jgi:hypothetical protein
LALTQHEEALTLMTSAIEAGIFNDLGSGSNIYTDASDRP